MKKHTIFVVSLLLGLLGAFAIYQHVGFENVFDKLKFFNGWQLIALFSFTIARVFVWILRWKLILNKLGHKDLKFLSLSASRIAEISVSYATPGIYWGGEGIRIYSLKKHHDMPIAKATTSVLLDRLFDIFGFYIFLFIGLILAIFRSKFYLAVLLFIGTLIVLTAIFFILKGFGLKKILGWGVKFLHIDQIKSLSNGKSVLIAKKLKIVGRQMVAFLRKGPKYWLSIMIVSCLSFFLNVCQLFVFFIFLKETMPSFIDLFLARALMIFSGLSPIPGNLGVYEGASVLGFQMVGLSANLGLTFSLLARFFDVLFVGLGVVILVSYSGVFLAKAIGGSISNGSSDDKDSGSKKDFISGMKKGFKKTDKKD